LKAGVWFRRARLLIVSPDSRVNLARRQAETPLIPLFRFLRQALGSSGQSWLTWPLYRVDAEPRSRDLPWSVRANIWQWPLDRRPWARFVASDTMFRRARTIPSNRGRSGRRL